MCKELQIEIPLTNTSAVLVSGDNDSACLRYMTVRAL